MGRWRNGAEIPSDSALRRRRSPMREARSVFCFTSRIDSTRNRATRAGRHGNAAQRDGKIGDAPRRDLPVVVEVLESPL
jgi:hypothetical protein